MYDFYGQHKSTANISLGGSTRKVDKSTLLQSARAERYKREQERQENVAALQIQSWYRGCFSRNALAKTYCDEYDKRLKEYNKVNEEEKGLVLKELVKYIFLFYKPSVHYQRLVGLCQILLKLSSSKKLINLISSELPSWIHRLRKLLVLCCQSFSNSNITIPLRMLEVFTDPKTYHWLEDSHASKTSLLIMIYLVLKGYFKDLYMLINTKVPSDLEPSTKPPTPFADAVKDLVLKPINLLSRYSNDPLFSDKSYLVYKEFMKDILSPPMSEQMCYFLIPAVSSSIPLPPLLQVIDATDSEHSIWPLYSVLVMLTAQHASFQIDNVIQLVHSLNLLLSRLIRSNKVIVSPPVLYDSDLDDSDMEIEDEIKVQESIVFKYAKEKCFEMLNSKEVVSVILSWFKQKHVCSNEEMKTYVRSLGEISYNLLSAKYLAVHKSHLLTSMAFNQQLLRLLWEEIAFVSTKNASGKSVPLVHQISLGSSMLQEDQRKILPILGSFVVLFRYTLFSIYDSDFYNEKAGTPQSVMPFSLSEVIGMSQTLINIILGLICFIYPDVKIADPLESEWRYLCEMTTHLIKQLYFRDSRHKFCPDQHWLSSRACISIENVDVSEYLNRDNEEVVEVVTKPGMSTLNARSLAVLKYVPFAIPFLHRVKIFQKIINEDKVESQSTEQRVLTAAGINITVNRKYLYQDAFDQLSCDRIDDVKKVIRVQMVNAQGLEEAGIDGGGVFREFMFQLIKTGFDPSYGFFKATSQQLLYPNPEVGVVHQDFEKHLNFLGRMLGKIIYESMMVELPLAEFFLCKLLNRYGSDVDIYHLESLDPELYKNLLYLKNYDGDADDLSLNFTVMTNDYGETKLEELKPGGRDVCVTNSNKIEYIHLIADYRLNKQIRSHVNAFRAGLSDVINIEWLQMFDHGELQTLISGAPVPVNFEELRLHTNYSGNFTADDVYIQEFWNILSDLTDKQKRLFLKFVTSCSRPPLLGFSELYPKFCIHYGGEEDRLPTASTCMNFLKLPRYTSPELLRTRLIYAIEAEAGFELS